MDRCECVEVTYLNRSNAWDLLAQAKQMMAQSENGRHTRSIETHQHDRDVLVGKMMTLDANVSGCEVKDRSTAQGFKYLCCPSFHLQPSSFVSLSFSLYSFPFCGRLGSQPTSFLLQDSVYASVDRFTSFDFALQIFYCCIFAPHFP